MTRIERARVNNDESWTSIMREHYMGGRLWKNAFFSIIINCELIVGRWYIFYVENMLFSESLFGCLFCRIVDKTRCYFSTSIQTGHKTLFEYRMFSILQLVNCEVENFIMKFMNLIRNVSDSK